MEGRQEKLGFGSFKGRVSRLRGLPPKFCIPLVFGHMSARSDLRENVFWTPPGGKNKPISSKSYCSTSTSHQSNIESIMFFIYKKTPHLPFIGPKSCAVAMNLNLSGGSSVGSAVLMCILRSVKHIADRSWEK